MTNLKQAMYKNASVARGSRRDNDTVSTYKTGIRKFVRFMQEKYGINKIKNVYDNKQTYVQDFVNTMASEGYSPSTIKTYTAGICQGLRLSMGDIKREKVGAPTKGRQADANAQGQREAQKERYAQSVALSKATGLRRSELRNLRIRDLQEDESGKLCVVVEKGKGGKKQWQRLLPKNYDTVTNIFAISRKAYEASGKLDVDAMPVLAPDQTRNHINYHMYRREIAQDVVGYYTKLASSPEGRNMLIKDLIMRWNKLHSVRS